MRQNRKPLLLQRRFGPLFLVQFLGACNDNVLKFALLFLASFTLYADGSGRAEMLAVVATGIFILPYFLFSALAGEIADNLDKSKIIRLVKAAEILFLGLALIGFWLQSIPILLLSLFMMGVHSTFFGPIKYAILPQHLKSDEIMRGTGMVEAGTFIAILGGQLMAGMISPLHAGQLGFLLSLLGFAASLAIPSALPDAGAKLVVDRNLLRSSLTVLKAAKEHRLLWLPILGISWFFAAGAVLLSVFAPLVSGVLQARAEVATLFLLIFSVNVALGSLAINLLLKDQVSARFLAIATLLMGCFLLDLSFATAFYNPVFEQAGIHMFLQDIYGWRIVVDLVGISFSGGMFIVPLYALLQTRSAAMERSRTIAANNIMNAVVTVVLVAVASAALALGAGSPLVIGGLGAGTLFFALPIAKRIRRAEIDTQARHQ